MSRIATVFGATGLQGKSTERRLLHPGIELTGLTGSSVVQALSKDGTFKPRAVTRNVESEAARTLAEQGAEVVAADLGDKEAVKKAVEGAECVFAVSPEYHSWVRIFSLITCSPT